MQHGTFRVLLLAATVALLTACISGQRHDDLQKKRANQQIEIGMMRSEVEEILSREAFEYSYIEGENRINAIRRSDSGFIHEASVYRISFDDHNRVRDVEGEKLYTGP